MDRTEQIAQLKRTLTPEQCGMHAALFADYQNGIPIPWHRVLELVGEARESGRVLPPRREKPTRDQLLAVLGLSDGATAEEIKMRYRKLAAEHHPDRGGDVTMMQRINAAFAALEGK